VELSFYLEALLRRSVDLVTAESLRGFMREAIDDDPRLCILNEIDQRSQSMNPKPDQRDLLREGRAGAMFGE